MWSVRDSLDDLLSRDPAAALELAGYALQRLFAIYAESDDSAGEIGDAMAAIGTVYCKAAQRAKPEPETFTKALFKLVLLDEWGVLGTLDAYAEVLGSKGIATLEKLASARLDALPPPPRGDTGMSMPASDYCCNACWKASPAMAVTSMP